MTTDRSLRQRILDGDDICSMRIPMDMDRESVLELLERTPCDLLYIDCQHGPYTEWDIQRICSAAEEMATPVNVRIKHTRHAHLAGNYLDLGPLALKIPEVEDESTVQEAIDAFYFPPLGRRSWGGRVGYNNSAYPDRRDYAAWWNENGILGIKIESIRAVLTVRALAKPLVTYLDFGPADLQFDLECNPHPHLKTLEDCRAFVERELEGRHIRIL